MNRFFARVQREKCIKIAAFLNNWPLIVNIQYGFVESRFSC